MKTKFLLPVLAAIFAVGMSFTTISTNLNASDYIYNNGSWQPISEQSCQAGPHNCRVQLGQGGQIFDVYDEMNLSTKKTSASSLPKVIK